MPRRPILWAAAYFTSLREFRANLRPITLLALGLVTATTLAVTAVAHALIPGLGWAPALVLGAIVSPPDAVAATAAMRDLAVPRRVITVLEGESLVNDASALVLYRAAVVAAVSGSFGLADTLIQLVLVSLGAVLIGLAIGWVAAQVSRRTDDGFSEIAITLIAPYAAWVLAEQAQTSAEQEERLAREHATTVAQPTGRARTGAVGRAQHSGAAPDPLRATPPPLLGTRWIGRALGPAGRLVSPASVPGALGRAARAHRAARSGSDQR